MLRAAAVRCQPRKPTIQFDMISKLLPSLLLLAIFGLITSTGFAKDKEARHQAHREKAFKKLDANNDGSLSKEEFLAKKAVKKKHGKKHKHDKADKAKKGKKGVKARKNKRKQKV